MAGVSRPAIAKNVADMANGTLTIANIDSSYGDSQTQINNDIATYQAASALNITYYERYGSYYYGPNDVPIGRLVFPGNAIIGTSNDTISLGAAIITNYDVTTGNGAHLIADLQLYTAASCLDMAFFNQTGIYYFDANNTPVGIANNIVPGPDTGSAIKGPNGQLTSVNPVNASTVQGKSIYSQGIYALKGLISIVNTEAHSMFSAMQASSSQAQDIQAESNAVATLIANVSVNANNSNIGANATGDLPQDVVQFMMQNGITVNGRSILTYGSKGLNQGQLNAVKAALDNAASRATDLVSQDQLQVQQFIQIYNVLIAMINSLQTAMYNTHSGIAQKLGG